jgi:hypothetical protein
MTPMSMMVWPDPVNMLRALLPKERLGHGKGRGTKPLFDVLRSGWIEPRVDDVGASGIPACSGRRKSYAEG